MTAFWDSTSHRPPRPVGSRHWGSRLRGARQSRRVSASVVDGGRRTLTEDKAAPILGLEIVKPAAAGFRTYLLTTLVGFAVAGVFGGLVGG
jgi:hypothetical protein